MHLDVSIYSCLHLFNKIFIFGLKILSILVEIFFFKGCYSIWILNILYRYVYLPHKGFACMPSTFACISMVFILKIKLVL
jgi:hypothetical protein